MVAAILRQPVDMDHGHHDQSPSVPNGNAPEQTHDRHEGHSVGMFRARFWVTLVLTAPTLVLGHMIPSALGLEPPTFPGATWIPPVFGTLGFAYGGTALSPPPPPPRPA